MKDPNVRITEALINNEWVITKPEDLKKDMLIRMSNPDGSKVCIGNKCEFIVSGSPIKGEDGVWITPVLKGE